MNQDAIVTEAREWASAKVRVSPELMAEWTQWRTLDGELVTCSWGEPDADGYFEPVFTRRPDGWLASKEAEAAQRALDVDRLAWAVLEARSTTVRWKGSARATEPTKWDRIMAKRIVAAYNVGAGTSSESNSITDPTRPVASPNSDGSVDSRRD